MSITIIAFGLLVWGCRMRSNDIDDAERAVAASLSSTGPLEFRGVRLDQSDAASLVCGEVKGLQADYRPFAYFASTGRVLILPPAGSSAATMTVAPDFPDECIPDIGRRAVEVSAETK